MIDEPGIFSCAGWREAGSPPPSTRGRALRGGEAVRGRPGGRARIGAEGDAEVGNEGWECPHPAQQLKRPNPDTAAKQAVYDRAIFLTSITDMRV